MLELSLGGGAGGWILAHTHGGVILIDLTHFALLAVVIQAGICENK